MDSYEVWLRSNRRAAFAGLVVPVILMVLGLTLALEWLSQVPSWAQGLGWGLVGLASLFFALLGWYARTPRLAFDGEHLLVFLRSDGPVRVPIELVECFFLGSGLKTLPGPAGREVQMSHLAIRLAERASEWAQVEVKPALGKWCGGTITIYGDWCEPLSIALVQRLNDRLVAVQRVQTGSSYAGPAVVSHRQGT